MTTRSRSKEEVRAKVKKDQFRFFPKMSPYLQGKSIYVLTLLCILQSSVSGVWDVIIKIRFNELSTYGYSVIFSEDMFRSFYGCMCGGAENCDVHYSAAHAPFVKVIEVNSSAFKDNTNMPVYQCKNAPSSLSLNCSLQNETSISKNDTHAQTFRLNNTDCQSKYVTLAWFHKGETLINNSYIPDFEFCEPAFDCALSPSTEASKSSNKDDEGVESAGVIAGATVAAFVVVIVVVIVVVVVVRWKRRKNQGTKEPENQIVDSPPPGSLALSHVNTAADQPTNASATSETLETSPEEPSSTVTASVSQTDFSQC